MRNPHGGVKPRIVNTKSEVSMGKPFSVGVGFLAFTLVATVACAALAQTTPPLDTAVPVKPWLDGLWPWVDWGVEKAVLALVGAAGYVYLRVSGKQMEQVHRDALHRAAKTGAMNVLSSIRDRAAPVTINVKSIWVRDIVRYMETSVPQAIGALAPSLSQKEAIATAHLNEALLLAAPPSDASPSTANG